MVSNENTHYVPPQGPNDVWVEPDYCDCNQRCPKCGKLKLPTWPTPGGPYDARPIWIADYRNQTVVW